MSTPSPARVRLYNSDGGWVELTAPESGVFENTIVLPGSENNGFVGKSSVSGNVFVVVGERNGAPSVGNRLAMGDGATSLAVPLPYPCKLIAISGLGGPGHTGTTTYEVVKNGSLQGSSYRISYTNTTSSSTTFGTPLSFAAGDSFNAQATSVGAGAGGLITFVFRMD